MASNKSKIRSKRSIAFSRDLHGHLVSLESQGLIVNIPKMLPSVKSDVPAIGGRLERDMWIKADMSRPETFIVCLNEPDQRLLSKSIMNLPSTYQEEQKNED